MGSTADDEDRPVDRSPVDRPLLDVVDGLCRLQLQARRLGCTFRLHEADPGLIDLIGLLGLGEVLLGEGPGQAEQVEQGRVEEHVEPADGTG